METKKIFILFSLIVLNLSFKSYCQYDEDSVSGMWAATKGELVTFVLSGYTEVEKVDVSGLIFYFDKKCVKINKSFYLYSNDSCYQYIDRKHIKIKHYDQKNLILEMQYLGTHIADRVMWFDIYLKRK